MVTASFVLLVGFAGLAPIDGLYLHLWRYRLHAHPESRPEHGFHTVRAVLFPAILVLLYAGRSSGWPFLLGVGLVAADVAAQVADMVVEPASRGRLRGLSPFESGLHGVLITSGSASLALMLGSRSAAAWSPTAPATIGASYGPFAHGVLVLLLPAALLVAAVHVYLWARPLPLRQKGVQP